VKRERRKLERLLREAVDRPVTVFVRHLPLGESHTYSLGQNQAATRYLWAFKNLVQAAAKRGRGEMFMT
jgi:hypothetical protein